MRKILVIIGLVYLIIPISANCQPYFEWANQVGSNSSDLSYQIATDNYGNSYQVGAFSGTVDFDPGPGVFNMTDAGNTDIYVRKLDGNDNLIWAKRIGGDISQGALSITIDNSENVLLTGNFDGTVDFDPGSGVNNLTSSGGNDAFILKLTSNGDFVWAKHMGNATVNEAGRYIITDSMNNVYSAGQFQGTVDFDPGPGVFNLSSTAAVYDGYIQKLDSNGNFVWAKQIEGSDLTLIHSMDMDVNNDICIIGSFSGTADFDPGSGIVSYTSNNYDIFVLKLTADGTYLWAKQIGAGYTDNGFSISADINGSLYLTGSFGVTVDFDPGAGVFNMTSNGNTDIFIAKLDGNGNFIWAKQMGAVLSDIGQSIIVSNNGKLYCTGRFKDVVDFDPNVGVFNLTSNGNYDIFTICLDTAGAFEWANSFGGTGLDVSYSITLGNNGSIYTSGYFKETVDFDPTIGVFNLTAPLTYYDGFVQKLSVCNSVSNGVDVITACASHQWIDGNTYTSSNNTATYTIFNGAASGCDSVVTLDLTILPPTTSSINESTCGSYTVPSGDETYSVSGVYHDTIPNTVGCDSVITIDLTVNTVDASVTQNQTTLTANTSGLNYQWIDCNNGNTPISGETGQSFTPVSNGSYAVIVDNGLCTDTSDCFLIEGLGLEDHQSDYAIIVYPNPNKGNFTISNMSGAGIIQIYSLDGKFVKSILKTDESNKLDISLELESGVYSLSFVSLDREVIKAKSRIHIIN